MALNLPSKQNPERRRAAEENVLMREVDDAVRQDQYSDFARRYGKLLIGVFVLGMAAFGGYLFWDSRQEAAMERQSEALVAALDQVQAGNLDGAVEGLAPLDGETGGAAIQAALIEAGAALEQDRAEDAAAIYAQIAANDDAPQLLRDMATVRQVAATFDTIEPAEAIERLEPLAVPGKPFFASAGELVAMAYLEQGKDREAGTLLAAIAKDDTQPEGLRSRARQMAGALGVDAIEDVDAVLEQMRTPAGGDQPAQ